MRPAPLTAAMDSLPPTIESAEYPVDIVEDLEVPGEVADEEDGGAQEGGRADKPPLLDMPDAIRRLDIAVRQADQS